MSFEKNGRKSSFWSLGALVGLNLTGFSLATDGAHIGSTPMSPNIVFILLDDLDQKVTGPYFDEVLPFTMSLKSDGVYFKNAFAPTPLCCPARASVLTGKYAHNTGVLGNRGENGGYEAFKEKGNEAETIAVALKNRGYQTAAFGKYLNGYVENNSDPQVPEGWSAWHVFAAGSYYTGSNYSLLEFIQGKFGPITTPFFSNEEDYSTDVLGRIAREFISEQATHQDQAPFFLYLAPTAPHSPLRSAVRHQDLEKRWANTLPTDRANYFNDGDTVLDKPYWLRIGWDLRQGYKDKIQDVWMRRLGSLYAVDEMIRDLVASLKEKELWDNTILVVTSDNGYSLGAHSLLGKRVPYEESLRVPLLIAGGKNLNLKQGISDEHYVLLSDHAPTLLDLADASSGIRLMDGRSLVPILTGTAHDIAWRDDFLVEFGGDTADESSDRESETFLDHDDLVFFPNREKELQIPSYVGIRGRIAFCTEDPASVHEFSYFEWNDPRLKDAHGKTIKEYELYNLDDDPDQRRNLLDSEGETYQELHARLSQRLEKLKACVAEDCRQ